MALFRRWSFLAALVAPLALAAAACGGDSGGGATPAGTASTTSTAAAAATTPAKPAGSITVYSGRSEALVQKVIDNFQQQSGIKVNVKYGDTTALAALLVEEGNKSPADVFFSQDGGALGAVAQAGLLAKLPEATLAKVAAPYRSREGSWVGVSGRARVIVYNPGMVSAASLPKSYKELTQPAWQGKVGWAPTNSSFQTFVTAVRKVDGEAAAEAWLKAMKANGAREYKDNTSVLMAVESGEIAVGLINHYYLYGALKSNAGMKAQNGFFAANDPGSLVNVAGVGLLKSSKNPAAAQAFIDYLLSAEAQRYFSEQTFEYPLVSGIAADSRLRPLAQIDPPDIDLANLQDLQGTLALLRSTGVLP